MKIKIVDYPLSIRIGTEKTEEKSKDLKKIGKLQARCWQNKFSLLVVLPGNRCIRQGQGNKGTGEILQPWCKGLQLQEAYRK
jgi:hypothetical protein